MAKIANEQLRSLIEALVQSFPARSDLAIFMATELGHPLERITTASGLDAMLFEVIEWVEARGLLESLVEKASLARPGAPALMDYRCRWPQEGDRTWGAEAISELQPHDHVGPPRAALQAEGSDQLCEPARVIPPPYPARPVPPARGRESRTATSRWRTLGSGVEVGWHGESLPTGVRRATEAAHFEKKRYWCTGKHVGEVLMVWVKPGAFFRGSAEEVFDGGFLYDGFLEHGLYLGVYPVTAEQYRRVIPDHPGEARHPVSNVNWLEAREFCRRTGFRLPLEAEWVRAARGEDERVYPWGNEAPTARHAWFDRPLRASLCDVGDHPAGASPFGLEDLAGNVWEWCEDGGPGPSRVRTEEPQRTKHALRGGSAHSDVRDVRISSKQLLRASESRGNFGFRLARDASPGG